MLKRSDCPCEWRWKEEAKLKRYMYMGRQGAKDRRDDCGPGIKNKNRGPVVRVAREGRIGGMIEQRLMVRKNRWWCMGDGACSDQEHAGESSSCTSHSYMTHHNIYVARPTSNGMTYMKSHCPRSCSGSSLPSQKPFP